MQARDFSFLQAGDAGVIAGVVAVCVRFELGADNIIDAENLADGRDDELIGGRNNQQFVPRRAVAFHQRPGHIRDMRRDEFGGKLAVHSVQLFAAETRQRCEMEFQKGIDVQTADLIVAVELLVLPFRLFGIDQTLFNQILRPGMVGIRVNQRIVQIENG